MRHSIPLLVFVAGFAGPGMSACSAEPMPSRAAPPPTVTVTVTVTTEEKMTSTDAHQTEQSRIPLLDREAPDKVETATFALG